MDTTTTHATTVSYSADEREFTVTCSGCSYVQSVGHATGSAGARRTAESMAADLGRRHLRAQS